jgi:hypothetical protein
LQSEEAASRRKKHKTLISFMEHGTLAAGRQNKTDRQTPVDEFIRAESETRDRPAAGLQAVDELLRREGLRSRLQEREIKAGMRRHATHAAQNNKPYIPAEPGLYRCLHSL